MSVAAQHLRGAIRDARDEALGLPIKRLRMSLDWYLKMCKSGKGTECALEVVDPLPQDAEIVRVGYDETGWLNVIIRSDSFERVPEGQVVPVVDAPQFRVACS